MNDNQLTTQMQNIGVIPVFNHSDIETCKKVLDAAYKAGIRVFEFTNRATNSFEVFAELSKYAKKYSDLELGIGTIFTSEDAQKFIDAGAKFIVSPALVEEVIVTSKKNNIICIPGCATLTEVYKAKTLGCDMVKAFPGNLLGPAFVKSILSVIPDIKVMPTGGVQPTEDNLKTWFDAGVTCVGMGSQLFDKADLNNGNFEKIEKDISKAIQIAKKFQ